MLNKMMTAKEIRSAFLEFFKSKQHDIVPSAPMVIKNDPTLMFTNAGMNQFKDYFLGNAKPKSPRATDTQKCLRVSGKHNDLEEVGLDTYHHTMFEMLGNWSFGDYFKKEAIDWSWELLTQVYKLPKERLYVTIFEGDSSEGLEKDNEAGGFWEQHLPSERILNGNKKDNFWEMGDTGPCGPCSEIHIDLRSEKEREQVSGMELVNADHPEVIEVWNLVFMQFNRKASGELEALPDTHVDTGMGFERLVMAIQGKKSNYDTDLFQPLIQSIAKQANVTYGNDNKIDIAVRVIADHIRANTFAIADGQLPSNNGAGYVIRRILRRAVRYGYTFLGFKEPFMYKLVDILSEQFEGVFPEVASQKDFIAKVIKEEEASFLRTLENGLKILGDFIQSNTESKQVDGETVFLLYDTFGFPADLTELIARENNFTADLDGFEAAMAQQKERARSAAASSKDDWEVVHEGNEVSFVGHDQLQAVSKILKYRKVSEKKKHYYQIVLNNTPFYAESGGQVGDTGFIQSGEHRTKIIDTQKENDLIVHIAEKLPKDITGDFLCSVDGEKRLSTMANHTATHLLHAALKEVLGDHVAQKGSLVNEQLLRFDFSHFSKMSEQEIARVERIVNRRIRQNIPLDEQRNVPIEEAKKMGATALFGEKYGDFVRVITFDPSFSRELCGGTHVAATGQIGSFKIISESSSAAGVRRIEAISADAAEAYLVHQESLINEINTLLKSPKNLKEAVSKLVEERNVLSKQLEALWAKELQNTKAALLTSVKDINGYQLICEKVTLNKADELRQLAYDLRAKMSDSHAIILAADIAGKPQIAVMFSDDLVKNNEWHAGKTVKELAKAIKGGGGGQPFFATAGGKDVVGLNSAIESANQLFGQ